MVVDKSQQQADLLALLSTIVDPEIPVVTIEEMGILRKVQWRKDHWEIIITPTYSGCPAMHMIETQINMALVGTDFEGAIMVTNLSPAWTTDWMTDEAKAKLEEYGIAPPNPNREQRPVRCPQCKSTAVVEVSAFGSTACKSLWKCTDCLEPFDYFKCH